jgi:hypothetical protein
MTNVVQVRLANFSARSGRPCLRSSALLTRLRPLPTRSATRKRKPLTKYVHLRYLVPTVVLTSKKAGEEEEEESE